VTNSSGSQIYDSDNFGQPINGDYDDNEYDDCQIEVPLGRPIYQQWSEPEYYSGHTPVFGSWVINDAPAGIIIREDKNLITNSASTVVPHVIVNFSLHPVVTKILDFITHVRAGFSTAVPAQASMFWQSFSSFDALFQQQDHFGASSPVSSQVLSQVPTFSPPISPILACVGTEKATQPPPNMPLFAMGQKPDRDKDKDDDVYRTGG